MLIKRLVKFCSLSWNKQWLVCAAFVLLGLVRLMVLAIPFRYLTRVLGVAAYNQAEQLPGTVQSVYPEIIRGVIQLVSPCTPWESKCLVQAITAKILLRFKGLSSTLYLGVARNDQHQLIAHAWLRCGQTIVTGGAVNHEFTVVSWFADAPGVPE